MTLFPILFLTIKKTIPQQLTLTTIQKLLILYLQLPTRKRKTKNKNFQKLIKLFHKFIFKNPFLKFQLTIKTAYKNSYTIIKLQNVFYSFQIYL